MLGEIRRWGDSEMGRFGDGEIRRWGGVGRWGDGEMGKCGRCGEMGRWGDGDPPARHSPVGNLGRYLLK